MPYTKRQLAAKRIATHRYRDPTTGQLLNTEATNDTIIRSKAAVIVEHYQELKETGDALVQEALQTQTNRSMRVCANNWKKDVNKIEYFLSDVATSTPSLVNSLSPPPTSLPTTSTSPISKSQKKKQRNKNDRMKRKKKREEKAKVKESKRFASDSDEDIDDEFTAQLREENRNEPDPLLPVVYEHSGGWADLSSPFSPFSSSTQSSPSTNQSSPTTNQSSPTLNQASPTTSQFSPPTDQLSPTTDQFSPPTPVYIISPLALLPQKISEGIYIVPPPQYSYSTPNKAPETTGRDRSGLISDDILQAIDLVNEIRAEKGENPLSQYTVRSCIERGGKKAITAANREATNWRRKCERLQGVLAQVREEKAQLQAKKTQGKRFKEKIADPTFRQKIAEAVVCANMFDERGNYTPSFRRAWVDLMGETRSIRSASRAAHSLYEGLLTKNARVKFPGRTAASQWTVLESETENMAWVQSIKGFFGVTADGSHRGSSDFFPTSLFWFDFDVWEPRQKMVNLTDIAGSGDADTMSDAVLWTVVEKCRLEARNWIYSNSDSTNSMSGVGATGGTWEQVRRALQMDEETQPRGACVLHALHLAYANTRPTLMFGPLPAKLDRTTSHVWNLLWDCWKLFGADNQNWFEYKRVAKELGLKLTKTWKPVATRWLYEYYATTWLLKNCETIRALHDALLKKHGPQYFCAPWNRLMDYLADDMMVCRVIVLHAFLGEVVVRAHARFCGHLEAVLFKPGETEGRKLPPGFNAPGVGSACRFLRQMLDEIEADPCSHFANTLTNINLVLSGPADTPKRMQFVPMLKLAAKTFRESAFVWLDAYQELPLLTFEMGGPDSRIFCLAFLSEFNAELALTEAQKQSLAPLRDVQRDKSLLKYFTDQIHEAKPRAYKDTHRVDTYTLVQTCQQDSEFMSELLEHATTETPLHHLPKLYRWICGRCFGMKTDQQKQEGHFNLKQDCTEHISNPGGLFQMRT